VRHDLKQSISRNWSSPHVNLRLHEGSAKRICIGEIADSDLMIYSNLVAIAKVQSFVRWTKSGIIEKLTLVENGRILACRALDGSRGHLIRQHAGEYFCEPLPRCETVQMGDGLK
jgi:hypothetical protein